MASETRNALLDKTIDVAYADNPTLFGGFDRAVIQQAFAAALDSLFPAEIALSTTSPDFESVMLQLLTELSNDPVWYDFSTSKTGQTLIRAVAAGIAYDQFSIERALQEAFGHLASSPNAIYATTELLGVRVSRVIPATVTVRFVRSDMATLFELPAFTTFTIDSVQFFNRDRIIFPIDSAQVDAQLAQGTLLSNDFLATGQPYFELEIGDGTADFSDTDVYVSVAGKAWQRSVEAPWTFTEQDEKFYDTTAPNGNIRISFGNNVFGKAPAINTTLGVTWVRTLGEAGHNFASGLDVTYNGPSIDTQLVGTTLSNITNARDMQEPDFYAKMAPHMRASPQNAVRRPDYRRWATEYPGVRDALFRGQAELGPQKRSMMNVIGVTLLTDTTFDDVQWYEFSSYMQEKGIFQCQFLRIDPQVIPVFVEADVYCSTKSSLPTIQTTLEQNVRSLFQYRLGWIGYEIWKSDITDILEGVGELGGIVEYVDLKSPTSNLVMTDKASYIQLTGVKLNMFYSKRDNFAGRLDINLA